MSIQGRLNKKVSLIINSLRQIIQKSRIIGSIVFDTGNGRNYINFDTGNGWNYIDFDTGNGWKEFILQQGVRGDETAAAAAETHLWYEDESHGEEAAEDDGK